MALLEASKFPHLLEEQEKLLLGLLEGQQRSFRETLRGSFAKLSRSHVDTEEVVVAKETVPECQTLKMQELELEEVQFRRFPSEPNKYQPTTEKPEVERGDSIPSSKWAPSEEIDSFVELPVVPQASETVFLNRRDRLSSGDTERSTTRSCSTPTGTAKRNWISVGTTDLAEETVSMFPRTVDRFAGLLACFSAILITIELELEGRSAGAALGEEEAIIFDTGAIPFRAADALFDCLFVVEFLLQIMANGKKYFRRWSTIYDVLMVMGCIFDLGIIVFSDTQSDSHARRQLMRAMASLRVIRLLKPLRWFTGVHMLLRACESFTTSLFWSMVVLTIFMVAGSLIVGNLLSIFVMNPLNLFEDRVWIWKNFGTAYRSLYTFYEITFAGNWPSRTRPVMDKVSHAFAIIWIAYITIIVFALIRVITAIFLKDTLDAASNDAELQIAQNLKVRDTYVKKLEDIFDAIDDGGDGLITEAKLDQILANPKVKAYFQTLDVDISESAALFHILDDGDGEVTLDEFINGILRCKGTARAIDQVALHTDVRAVEKKVTRLMQMMEQLGVCSQNLPPASRSSMRGGLRSSVGAIRSCRGEVMKAFRSSTYALPAMELVPAFSRNVSPP